MRSRVIAALLALLILVGCSLSKPERIVAEKPIELVILTTFSFSREALDQLIDLYEAKHSNVSIRVKEYRYGFANQDGSINKPMLEGIDIILQPSGVAKTLYTTGVSRELFSLRLPPLDPIVAGLADRLSREGGTRVGVPLLLAPAGLQINTEIFTKANVALPPVDWTIQEFEQTLLQLKDAGVTSDLDLSFVFDSILAAHGGQVFDPATGAMHYDRPEAQEALAWMGQAVRNGLLAYTPSTAIHSIRPGGSYPPAIGGLGTEISLPPNSVLQPMPRGPAGRYMDLDGILGVVTQSSPSPEVASDFLRAILADPEAQRSLARSGIRPLTTDSQALAIWREKIGDRNAEAVDLALMSAPIDRPLWPFVAEDLQPFVEGKSTLEHLVERLQQQRRR